LLRITSPYSHEFEEAPLLHEQVSHLFYSIVINYSIYLDDVVNWLQVVRINCVSVRSCQKQFLNAFNVSMLSKAFHAQMERSLTLVVGGFYVSFECICVDDEELVACVSRMMQGRSPTVVSRVDFESFF